MNNLFNELKDLLIQDDRFMADDDILKNRVTEFALKLDPSLLKLLLSHPRLKEHFFVNVDGTLVFDQQKFIRFVNNKAFLPDSYTSFKNKIGLTVGDDYLQERREVALVWPYKDCVLQGGQDKEDAKRDEIFWNEILAPDEIDRLFDPKILTNFKRYDTDGEHPVTDFDPTDNLIIKGNNLLTLHSLKKRFAGKVKLIYIDPPYNIGNDSFNYNDRFNHSTWLTFMKNRLSVARELLAADGAIFIQIDHHELGYLIVLLDEIFGVNNKAQIMSVKTASPSGFKAFNPGPIDVAEYILFYAKDKSRFSFKVNYVPADYHTNYNKYVERDGNPEKWKLMQLKEKVLEAYGFKSEKEAREQFKSQYDAILRGMIADFAFQNPDNVASIRDLHKPTKTVRELQLLSRETEGTVITYQKQDGSSMYLYNGGELTFYSRKIKELDGKPQVTELLSNFWDHISWAGIAKEGGVRLKNGKKPEKLIKQILEIATEEGDIVLDFYLGSGTTAAACHKSGRQYIGIEQLNYAENDSVVRLRNVIQGDQTGISKSVNWKGGGKFIYCELMQWNQRYIDRIETAATEEELQTIWQEMQEKAFLSYWLDLAQFNQHATTFDDLSLDDRKKFLLEVLDKNQLYVNLSEMDDVIYGVSDTDKALNRKFYGLE